MSFGGVRRFLFQVHMWVGLTLGILLALLGLSGSVLVYDDAFADLLAPPPKASGTGAPLSLDRIAEIARGIAGHGQIQIALPERAGAPIVLRSAGQDAERNDRGDRHHDADGTRERSRGPRAPVLQAGPVFGRQIFLDPVSGAVLGERRGLPAIIAFAHQLHGNFLLGREGGRAFVGWLGVAMLILGISGLVLWWPRRGQWRYAFFVRRSATGLRFHRELHAAVGIWIFLVFMVVSFSGVAIAFPLAIRAIVAPGMPAAQPLFSPRTGPTVEPVKGATPMTPERAVAVARHAVPDAPLRSITLPARRDKTIAVGFATTADVMAMVYVDPYRGTVAGVRDPLAGTGLSDRFMAWQRPLHAGNGLGAIWRFLVFLSGLMPTLFVVTGIVMWLKKRWLRLPMTVPQAENAMP